MGDIRDEVSQTPLAGAVIMAYREDGAVGRYSVSDSNGSFRIALPDGTKQLTVTLLGYKIVTLNEPFPPSVKIRMAVNEERISSAVIISHSVQERGDTLSYDMASVRGRNDRNLGDLLKRLPGIDVTDAGLVRYNGRPINRLYIEGRDILKSDYDLATKSLDAKAIKSIDVYRGHQPLKVLRGIVESEEAALNITLEDYVKGSWTGSLDAAGGYSWEPSGAWSSDLLGLYVGRVNASINKVNTNSIGSLPTFGQYRPNVFRLGEEMVNRYQLRDFFSLATDNAPLEDVHAALNQSVSAQSVNHHAFSEDVGAGISIKYSRDRLFSEYTGRQQYLSPDGAEGPLYSDLTERQTGSTFVSVSADYVSNKDRHYLKEVLYADLRTGDASANINSAGVLNQNTLDNGLNVDNILDVIWRKSDRGAIRLSSYSQFVHKRNVLCVPQNSLEQDVDADAFYSTMQVSGISRTVRGWSFSLSPTVTFLWRGMETGLSGPLPAELPGQTVQSLSVWSLRPILDAQVSRRIQQWRVGVDLNAEYRHHSFRTDRAWRESAPVMRGSAFLKYARRRVEMELSYTYALEMSDDQVVGPGLVLCSYNTLWTGSRSLTRLPLQQVDLMLGYREPLSGIYFKLFSSAFSGQTRPESRVLFDDYILRQESDEFVRMRGWQNRLTMSKGLPSIRGKVDASVSYDLDESKMRQNGLNVDYQSATLRGQVEIKVNPWRWLGLEYDGSYARTAFSAADSEEPVHHGLRQTFSIHIMPDGGFDLNCSAEHLLDVISSSQSTFLVDAGASWTISRRVRLYLKGINLMNERTYSRTRISPLLISSSGWKIRPRTILLGAEWKF